MPRTYRKSSTLVTGWLSSRNSPHTASAYKIALDMFAAHVKAKSADRAASHLLRMSRGEARHLVTEWRAAMLAAGAAPGSANLRVGAIRSLVIYAADLGWCGWTLKVPDLPGGPVRDTTGPSRANVLRLLSWIETRSGPLAARDTALVRMLYDLALRVGEACALDVGSTRLDPERPTVQIRGKGRAGPETLSLPEPTRAALAAYAAARGPNEGPLFLSARGKRLTTRAAHGVIGRLGRASGIGRVTPHGLRHSAITYALEVTGGDVARVAQFSRHRKVQTVMIYDDRRRASGAEIARLVAVSLGMPAT